MHFLQAMQKHRPVGFSTDSGMDFNNVIRANTDQVLVEGRVVDFAKAESIRHDGEAVWV